MRLVRPIVWSDRHRLHEPGGEVWIGVRTPGTEVSQRSEAIRDALRDRDATFVDAEAHPDEDALAVHDAALLDYLRGAWDEWDAAGLPTDPGEDPSCPMSSRTPASRRTSRPRSRTRPGYFACDTMTLIGPGTWQAARGAVDAALTAADLVAEGAPAAYACCHPPGHHVTRTAYGGSCYLNNAAAAAAGLRARTDGPVAVIDIDAHHGNGTQAIFYDRADVRTASVHLDPGAGWFPHYPGFAGETGAGSGAGANRNAPLALGSGDNASLAAIGELAAWARDGGARGYMATLAVTDPEHRYRCAVAMYGDVDIVTSWAQGDRLGVQDLERMMGPPAAARPAYRAGSPVHRLANVRVPILIAHGERDDRVNPAQSEEHVAELRRLGETFEYITYPTEAHGFLRAGPQLHFHRRLERFLDWYLM